MKRTFLIPVIALSLCANAVALEATATSLAETELIALDDAWINAEVSGDRLSLERILDERFLATWASSGSFSVSSSRSSVNSVLTSGSVTPPEVTGLYL